MSTTFGIKVNGEWTPVAQRHGVGQGKTEIIVTNPLVLLLPKDTLLKNDNSSQGIETVGDLHIALSKQSFSNNPLNNPLNNVFNDEFPEPHVV